MPVYDENIVKLDRVTTLINDWVNKQGEENCWWFPELLEQLAAILEIPLKAPSLPPIEKFREGCRRYTNEQYEIGS
jgi:hypothetical protein